MAVTHDGTTSGSGVTETVLLDVALPTNIVGACGDARDQCKSYCVKTSECADEYEPVILVLLLPGYSCPTTPRVLLSYYSQGTLVLLLPGYLHEEVKYL